MKTIVFGLIFFMSQQAFTQDECRLRYFTVSKNIMSIIQDAVDKQITIPHFKTKYYGNITLANISRPVCWKDDICVTETRSRYLKLKDKVDNAIAKAARKSSVHKQEKTLRRKLWVIELLRQDRILNLPDACK
ncbi:MAG: hypothetical protein JNM93_00025 [Bacteriovoracaceae bacterium]|nr:hypothetical protein [Bacteriovoracaceae bacterium]